MATQKRSRKHDPNQDVYVLQNDDDDELGEEDEGTIIETPVVLDWIEYNPEDEEEKPPRPGTCRVSFHVDLPEPIAQHLFAHHVKDGRLLVEFHPPEDGGGRRDPLAYS